MKLSWCHIKMVAVRYGAKMMTLQIVFMSPVLAIVILIKFYSCPSYREALTLSGWLSTFRPSIVKQSNQRIFIYMLSTFKLLTFSSTTVKISTSRTFILEGIRTQSSFPTKFTTIQTYQRMTKCCTSIAVSFPKGCNRLSWQPHHQGFFGHNSFHFNSFYSCSSIAGWDRSIGCRSGNF